MPSNHPYAFFVNGAAARLMFITLASLPAIASAQTLDPQHQWPSWRGPNGDGVAPHGDPPVEWSELKNIRWKTAVPGKGNASPVVWGDRVYLLTSIRTDGGQSRPPDRIHQVPDPGARVDSVGGSITFQQPAPGQPPRDPPPGGPPGDKPRGPGRGGPPRGEKPSTPVQFVVVAVDRTSGAIAWQKPVNEAVPHEGIHPDSTFASASPVTDGMHIYASFGSFGLYCLTPAGEVLWHTDLGDMQTRNSFGEGSSPALAGDTLVVNWDHEGPDFIVAFDKKTGQERWRTPRDEPTTWATPLIVKVGDQHQVLTPGTNKIRSYDLATGKEIWNGPGLTTNAIPSPVAADGIAYLMSGFRGAALKAVKLADARGSIEDSSPAMAWTFAKDTPYVPSPLLYQGAIYMHENNRSVLTCLDARTGSPHYGPQRLEGLDSIYASPVAAAGRVYLSSRNGKTLVIKGGPSYEVLATNTLDDGLNASPAIVGKQMFFRGESSLYCISAN